MRVRSGFIGLAESGADRSMRQRERHLVAGRTCERLLRLKETKGARAMGENGMAQARGSEVTFAVHPRPEVDLLTNTGHPRPWSAACSAVASTTAAEDVSRHTDTFMGDLIFLARFAFGRY